MLQHSHQTSLISAAFFCEQQTSCWEEVELWRDPAPGWAGWILQLFQDLFSSCLLPRGRNGWFLCFLCLWKVPLRSDDEEGLQLESTFYSVVQEMKLSPPDAFHANIISVNAKRRQQLVLHQHFRGFFLPEMEEGSDTNSPQSFTLGLFLKRQRVRMTDVLQRGALLWFLHLSCRQSNILIWQEVVVAHAEAGFMLFVFVVLEVASAELPVFDG